MSYKYSENTMRAEIDRLTRELAEAKARIAELERSHSEFLDARRAWLASDAIKQRAIDRHRAELAREQKRRREIDDEAFEYAEQVESLRAEVEALRAVLTECADDLEAEVNARASGELPRRIERDLEPVRKARALLSAIAARKAAKRAAQRGEGDRNA